MNGVEIATERLRLRPLGTAYLQTANAYATDREHVKYMLFMPFDGPEETMATLKEAEAAWASEDPDRYEFAVLRNDRHIGAVSVYMEDEGAELAWIIAPEHRGQGFACEAARAVVEYLSSHMGIRHFYAHSDAENAASRRVMEKLGMTRADGFGTRRNRGAARDSIELRYDLWL
ncbi:MAG: GNAT family N-acetyltransferase [Clostridia bacterium]|nr:GNAT family N-acetyltransferase [Clostridia bacterium]